MLFISPEIEFKIRGFNLKFGAMIQKNTIKTSRKSFKVTLISKVGILNKIIIKFRKIILIVKLKRVFIDI